MRPMVFSIVLIPTLMPAQGQPPQSEATVPHPDGGVRETLESIVISPIPNAPFTTTLQTEWVRTMSDGGTITLVNERRIARDSKGRFYQERFMLVPKNGKVKSRMTAIQIADPIQRTLLTCMMGGPKICRILTYSGQPAIARQPNWPKTGPLPDDRGFVNNENLGDGSIEGMATVGTRITTIFNPGAFGNDNKVTVLREFWYSPLLGINLQSTVNDPRFGTQTFTATNVSFGDPDPKLFLVPEGYRTEDERVPISKAPPTPSVPANRVASGR